jgi:catechol 2,3-dioxygenase-like lactoylglutathione lyase family enzyme
MRLARNRLRVNNIAGIEPFYRDHFGMQAFDCADGLVLGYDERQCLLEFHEGADEPFYGGPDGLYWKIGITLRDLDTAVAHLRQCGLEVSQPRQFLEIGYMCHLRDPNGLPIELLQQGFEGNEAPLGQGAAHPVADQATLAHVTLRISDLAAAKAVCENGLGMRLMSVQPVALADRAFCLYFYAWSQEALPNPDLEAVENREWLWARPYTLLELQHIAELDGGVRQRQGNEAGFDGLSLIDEDGRLRDVSAEFAVLS